MKKEYIVPETETVLVLIESVMGLTDSEGLDDDFCGKENNLIFEEDDSFGDTWGVDSNDLWGDEE